jgi:hypothetical protein
MTISRFLENAIRQNLIAGLPLDHFLSILDILLRLHRSPSCRAPFFPDKQQVVVVMRRWWTSSRGEPLDHGRVQIGRVRRSSLRHGDGPKGHAITPASPFSFMHEVLSMGFCHLVQEGRCTPIRHWYVSNVSIIFYAPCLFTHHLLCVLLHFVAFLCIFWN